MHPADIQAELKKRGITQKMIAQELRLSEFHVSAVINHPDFRPSDRVFRAIAEKIGRDHLKLFPEYYSRKIKRKKSAAA